MQAVATRSAYGTARTLASQLGLPLVSQLMSKTLGEEESADSELMQVARELMALSRTGVPPPSRRSREKKTKTSK